MGYYADANIYELQTIHNLKLIHMEFPVDRMKIPSQEIYIDPVLNGEKRISINKIMQIIDPIFKEEFTKIDSRNHPLYKLIQYLIENINIKYEIELRLKVHDPNIIELYKNLASS